jgi:hypothetical protein
MLPAIFSSFEKIDWVIFILFLWTMVVIVYWWKFEYVPPPETTKQVTTEPFVRDTGKAPAPTPMMLEDYPQYNPPRYGSNTCDPEQTELPITFPDPNEGVPPLELTTPQMQIFDRIKRGSLTCDCDTSTVNFCQ